MKQHTISWSENLVFLVGGEIGRSLDDEAKVGIDDDIPDNVVGVESVGVNDPLTVLVGVVSVGVCGWRFEVLI